MSKHQTIVPLIGNIGTLGTSQHQASKLSTRHGGNVKHGMHAKKKTQSRKAGKELKSRNAGNGMTVGKTNKIWGSQLGKYQN